MRYCWQLQVSGAYWLWQSCWRLVLLTVLQKRATTPHIAGVLNHRRHRMGKRKARTTARMEMPISAGLSLRQPISCVGIVLRQKHGIREKLNERIRLLQRKHWPASSARLAISWWRTKRSSMWSCYLDKKELRQWTGVGVEQFTQVWLESAATHLKYWLVISTELWAARGWDSAKRNHRTAQI